MQQLNEVFFDGVACFFVHYFYFLRRYEWYEEEEGEGYYYRDPESFATAQYFDSSTGFEDGWYCVWCGEKLASTEPAQESYEKDSDPSVSKNTQLDDDDSALEAGDEGQGDPRYCQACECALVYPGEVSLYGLAARAETLPGDAVDEHQPHADLSDPSNDGESETPDTAAAAAGCDGESSVGADAEEDPVLVELGEWARSVRDQVLTMKFQPLSASSGGGSRRLLRRRTSSSGASVPDALSRPGTAASASSGTEEDTRDVASAEIEGASAGGGSDGVGQADEPEAEWTEQELQEYWDWYYGTGSHDAAADAEYEEYNANYDFDLVDNNDYSSYAQWFAEDAGSATDGAGEVIFVFCWRCRVAGALLHLPILSPSPPRPCVCSLNIRFGPDLAAHVTAIPRG